MIENLIYYFRYQSDALVVILSSEMFESNKTWMADHEILRIMVTVLNLIWKTLTWRLMNKNTYSCLGEIKVYDTQRYVCLFAESQVRHFVVYQTRVISF